MSMFNPEFKGQIDMAYNSALEGVKDIIPWPFPTMKAEAIGASRGEIVTMGARSGHGKTTMAMALALNWLKDGYKVLIMSKEMEAYRLIHKWIIATTTITLHNIRSGNLSFEQQMELKETVAKLEQRFADTCWIYDSKKHWKNTVEMMDKHQPDVVIEDYLQINRGLGSNKKQGIADMMLEYKDACQRTKAAMLALSQLNRDIEFRDDPLPRNSDLANSDDILHTSADIVMLHYPYKLDPRGNPKDRVKVLMTKARYCPTFSFDVSFNGAHGIYRELPKPRRQ